MKKLNEWLTLVADLAVIAGIIFLAIEVHQNSQALRGQTRDSITDKEMEFYGWLATSPELAETEYHAFNSGLESLSPIQRRMWFGYVNAIFREWENFHYQYEQGLFSTQEYEARSKVWEDVMGSPAFATPWANRRELFSPDFRAEVDRVVNQMAGGTTPGP